MQMAVAVDYPYWRDQMTANSGRLGFKKDFDRGGEQNHNQRSKTI